MAERYSSEEPVVARSGVEAADLYLRNLVTAPPAHISSDHSGPPLGLEQHQHSTAESPSHVPALVTSDDGVARYPSGQSSMSARGPATATRLPDGSERDKKASSSSESSATLDKDVEKSEAPALEGKGNEGSVPDPNIVDWDGPDDPENPRNWPGWKKWIYAALLGTTTLVVTFASSNFSVAIKVTAKEFNVSSEIMILGQSLFVLGFAFGPLIWAPMSELYGRKIPLYTGYLAFAVMNIPVALAHDLQTIFVSRFFAGLFASAPLGIVGGYLADFFDPITVGLAVCIFSAMTFIGPIAGPIVGGFVTQSYLGWRWTQWLTLIMASFFGSLAVIFVPESFAPVLLKRRAAKLRFETKNWALHARSEESQINMKIIVEKYLFRPAKMTIMEPILVLVTIYIGFIYGVIYLFFEAFPISFEEERGFNLGVGALPFISLGVGVCFGASVVTWHTKTRVKRSMEMNGYVVPEERMIPMMVGAASLPIGLFWFAWTSSPNITPWPQIIAGAPIGMGIQLIFLQGLVYLIDVYKMHANSAIAANTFLRSLLGAGFPMFAEAMFHNLGVAWATSLLGFLSIAMFPVPILFFMYGARIRRWSKYTPDM